MPGFKKSFPDAKRTLRGPWRRIGKVSYSYSTIEAAQELAEDLGIKYDDLSDRGKERFLRQVDPR